MVDLNFCGNIQSATTFSFDDLQLLAKAEINPDDLADPIQLISIENRIKNKGILNADDMAILKLIRPADCANDLKSAAPYCPPESVILNQTILEGTNRSSLASSYQFCLFV
jgi:hypothetical protein